MYTCCLCHFEAELDDVMEPTAGGRCICLTCWQQTTGKFVPMSKALRRDLIDAAGVMMPDSTRNYNPHPYGYQG